MYPQKCDSFWLRGLEALTQLVIYVQRILGTIKSVLRRQTRGSRRPEKSDSILSKQIINIVMQCNQRRIKDFGVLGKLIPVWMYEKLTG